MKSLRNAIAAAATATTLLAAPAAHAQQWVTTGFSDLASGLEGGGGRSSSTGRAATRLSVGADMFVDENPEDIFGAAAVIAVEPRTAFGLDARYTRVVAKKFAFSGGVLGYLQPGSLVGPKASFEYRYPLSALRAVDPASPGSQVATSFLFTAGPELDVFVLGTDLPDKTIMWQAIFHVGLRVSF